MPFTRRNETVCIRTIASTLLLFALLSNLTPVRGDTVSSAATFNNAAIVYDFDTAPPAGTEVSVAIRPAGSAAAYQPAHPLSPLTGTRYAGSVFSLEPGSQYSVRLSSPAFPGDQFLSVTTRSDSFPTATGTVYHVKPGGDDSDDGLTEPTAFATVARGLSVAQAGDEIRLHDGRYFEGDLSAPRSGTATNPIVVRAAPGATPILDGTDTAFSPSFTSVGSNVYRTPAALAAGSAAYVDGTHLFRYASLTDLQNDKWGVPGFYSDGSHMYVRFPNDDAPGGHTVTVSAHTTGLLIEDQSNIHLLELGFESYGVGPFRRAVYIDGGDENLVSNCTFTNVGVGVALKRAADGNVVQDSYFNETSVGDWSFEAVKTDAEDYETGAVFLYASDQPNEGNVIRRNVIENMYDGGHLYSFDASGPTQNMDFHDNTLRNLVDDGLETDGAGSNVRIYGNHLADFLTGISVAPASGGPTYILRNVLEGWRNSASGAYEGYPIKLNVNSPLDTNWVYLYHNTAYSDEPNVSAFIFKGYSDWYDVISRNNIFAGTEYAMWSWPTGADANHPVDFDYDGLYTTDGVRFIRWAGVNYADLASFFAATGHEGNGISLVPGFVDASGGIFCLAPGSGLIDQGLMIPGVNDGYFGDAPDLGAFEAGGPVGEPRGLLTLAPLLLALRRRRRESPVEKHGAHNCDRNGSRSRNVPPGHPAANEVFARPQGRTNSCLTANRAGGESFPREDAYGGCGEAGLVPDTMDVAAALGGVRAPAGGVAARGAGCGRPARGGGQAGVPGDRHAGLGSGAYRSGGACGAGAGGAGADRPALGRGRGGPVAGPGGPDGERARAGGVRRAVGGRGRAGRRAAAEGRSGAGRVSRAPDAARAAGRADGDRARAGLAGAAGGPAGSAGPRGRAARRRAAEGRADRCRRADGPAGDSRRLRRSRG
jgi:hypothetical protein